VPAIESALATQAWAGVNVTIILPVADRDNGNPHDLAAAGVRILYLTRPYVHAKMILVDNHVFIGSQNFSTTSLDNNREVGIMLAGQGLVQNAYQVFRKDQLVAAGH